jgi:hypothetical protein
MTFTLGAIPDEALRRAFNGFYLWRDPAGRWHARPLRKLSPDEVAFGVLPELVADSLVQLAGRCMWQRSRRNIYRGLMETWR